MNDKTKNKKFPILSLRVTPEQMAYLDRESKERRLNIPKYVRKVLFPFEVPTTNEVLTPGKHSDRLSA